MSLAQPSAFDANTLAKTLFALRSQEQTKATSEFSAPQDLQAAMMAQNALVELEGASAPAWKVAMTPDGHAVTAPLHPYVETVGEAELAYVAGMKFEVEIALRLGKDLPSRDTPYSRSEIYDAVSQAHLGAELLSSAIEESGKVSFPLFVADRIGNRGYVLGPALPKSFVDSVGSMKLKVTQGNVSMFDGTATHPVGDVLAWLIAYASDNRRPANSLSAGSLITTGALSGAMPLSGSGKVEVRLADEHALDVVLVG